jgi:cytochrome oxidase Cu insertion factor (SCO1/SenC/PrrC family)
MKGVSAMPRIPRLGLLIAAAALVAVGCDMGRSAKKMSPPPSGKAKEGVNEGDLAPEITGKDADGKSFKLSDYRGKVVLLDFWFEG